VRHACRFGRNGLARPRPIVACCAPTFARSHAGEPRDFAGTDFFERRFDPTHLVKAQPDTLTPHQQQILVDDSLTQQLSRRKPSLPNERLDAALALPIHACTADAML